MQGHARAGAEFGAKAVGMKTITERQYFHMIRLAADANCREAQRLLAACYKHGEGVDPNPTRKFHFAMRAA